MPPLPPFEPPSTTLTGLTLGGRYCIEHQVGAGGMAHVYFARDLERDNGEVAVKVLLPQLASDAESVERLRREALVAARLEHPNVCPITDMGETPEGHLYLAMPFLPGEPLAMRQARGPLSVNEGIPLLVDVCRGLGHAHGLDILHRDLKPENIMLVPDPGAPGGTRAVLMDFGLAKVVREEPNLQKLTRSGIVLGTPEFMSPEQLFGRDLDGRSDLYSTGVLAFEMFTGRIPFNGKSPQEVALARLKGPPLRLRAVLPDLPETLEIVIARALAQKAEDRFQSMDELGAAFASVTRA